MPTLWAHSFYWSDQTVSTVVGPVVVSRGGYPAWQAGVIMGSAFGVIGSWWDDLWSLWRSWFRLGRRVDALSPARRHLLLQTLDSLESSLYGQARKAVRATAVTIGFNKPEAWLDYSRSLKQTPRQAENVYRHVRACDLLQRHAYKGSTGDFVCSTVRLPNPTVNFLVELAYQEYAIKPWGDR